METFPWQQVVLGDGLGGFGARIASPLPDPFVVADFDEDGNVDAAVARQNAVRVHLGDGAGHLAAGVDVPAPFTACELEPVDLDADGHMDLVTSAGSDHGQVLYGDGTGGFPETQPIHTASTPGSGQCNGVISAQIDGAGKPDLAFISPEQGRIAILLNQL